MLHFKILCFILFVSFSSFSQDHIQCGTDEMHQQLFQQRPDLIPGMLRAHERLETQTATYLNSPTKSNATYIIPVVFHVIHNYGVENIPDYQIIDAVNQLNIQYRKLNADTSEIVSSFQSIAADTKIEFRLAGLDPQGNCTNGITRTASSLTLPGNHDVKSLIHWPPNQYLNIYVCTDAAGLAGHCILPSNADTIPEWDGIVMRHDYVGTVGTSEFFRRTVLSHEIGHYLNLQHIWGGNNVPNFYYLPVGQAGNCAFDDDVMDTPNTIGYSTCNLSSSSCGFLSNVQNYMDYAYCARMFTQGQVDRMHACLNSTVAGRNNLWTPANLLATGVTNPSLCKALISSNKRIICAGEEVTFYDVSAHNVTTRNWTFSGGNIATSADSLVNVTYLTAGEYDVLLQVSDGVSTKDSLFQNYIKVLESPSSVLGFSDGFEGTSTDFQSSWFFPSDETETSWEHTNLAAFSGNNSVRVRHFTDTGNRNYEIQTPSINAQGLASFSIDFDWAFAQKTTPSSTDALRIQYSTDCGTTWLTKKTYFGTSTLPSVSGTITEEFFPLDTTEWNSDTVIFTNSNTLGNNLIVRFRFDGKGGNNFYLDNVRIGSLNSLATTEMSLTNISLWPNPVMNELNIVSRDEVFSLEIVDIHGRKVLEKKIENDKEIQIPTSNLDKGVYLIWIKTSKGKFLQRFVKE